MGAKTTRLTAPFEAKANNPEKLFEFHALPAESRSSSVSLKLFWRWKPAGRGANKETTECNEARHSENRNRLVLLRDDMEM